MQEERAWDWTTRRVLRVSRPDGAGKRQSYFDDVAVVLWVVTVFGIVVLCGALLLLALSSISATVPVSLRIEGPTFDGGAMTESHEQEAVLVDDDWVYGPKLTR